MDDTRFPDFGNSDTTYFYANGEQIILHGTVDNTNCIPDTWHL